MDAEKNIRKQMHHDGVKIAPQIFTASYAEDVRRTIEPARLALINPTYARSDDGTLELRTVHGGGGFAQNYELIIRDKGNRSLQAIAFGRG